MTWPNEAPWTVSHDCFNTLIYNLFYNLWFWADSHRTCVSSDLWVIEMINTISEAVNLLGDWTFGNELSQIPTNSSEMQWFINFFFSTAGHLALISANGKRHARWQPSVSNAIVHCRLDSPCHNVHCRVNCMMLGLQEVRAQGRCFVSTACDETILVSCMDEPWRINIILFYISTHMDCIPHSVPVIAAAMVDFISRVNRYC